MPVSRPKAAPFLGSPAAFRRFFQNSIHTSSGRSPIENNTWFIQGEIRSTMSLDCKPHEPQRITVAMESSIHDEVSARTGLRSLTRFDLDSAPLMRITARNELEF